MTKDGAYNPTPVLNNACTPCPRGQYCTGGPGGKPIEYMAHNLPIISVDVPGLREMFGPAAHYVPMNERFEINPDDCANKMIEMITNQRMRTRSAINAYARYIQKYTARRMVSDTLRLYNKVLGLKK